MLNWCLTIHLVDISKLLTTSLLFSKTDPVEVTNTHTHTTVIRYLLFNCSPTAVPGNTERPGQPELLSYQHPQRWAHPGFTHRRFRKMDNKTQKCSKNVSGDIICNQGLHSIQRLWRDRDAEVVLKARFLHLGCPHLRFFFFFFGARHHHIQTRGCTDCMRACHRLRYLLFGAKKQTDTIIELQSPKLEHRLLGQAFSKVIATSGCIIYQITALKIQPKANITNTVDLSSVYPMYSLQMGSYRE